MTLVNGKVVVTREQLNLLALAAEPTVDHCWEPSVSQQLNWGLPVVVVDEWPPAVDLGDDWWAMCLDGVLYVWNQDEVKACLERRLQESTFAPTLPRSRYSDHASVGLFQQRPATQLWRGFTV